MGGSHIFFKSWFDKCFKYINDLVNKNGKFYRTVQVKCFENIIVSRILYKILVSHADTFKLKGDVPASKFHFLFIICPNHLILNSRNYSIVCYHNLCLA